ncbi:MAG: DNA gyrase inhibitor YacG [Pirellulales bacterium]|nr:DNA gyrase inhibitor YacG [Pirellulales bacterium]
MRCPTCNTEFLPFTSVAKPFCSQRCRSIDLGRWLGEEHALPHVPGPEDEETPEDDWSGGRSSAAEEEAS